MKTEAEIRANIKDCKKRLDKVKRGQPHPIEEHIRGEITALFWVLGDFEDKKHEST